MVLFSPFILLCSGSIGMDCVISLFDLILYVPVNNFSVNGSSWVEPVLSKDKCVKLKDATQ